MIDFDPAANEIFQILRSFDYEVLLYDDEGSRVYETEGARRFFASPANILVSIVDQNENSTIRLYLGDDIELAAVTGLADSLRTTATRYQLLFNVRRWDRIISPKDFASNTMNERRETITMKKIVESFYGTTRKSYLRLENAKLTFEHSKTLVEGASRLAKVRKVVVENAYGEKFTVETQSSAVGIAMAQHVNMGGSWDDVVGKHILTAAEVLKTHPAMPAIRESLALLSDPARYAAEAMEIEEGARPAFAVKPGPDMHELAMWVREYKSLNGWKNSDPKVVRAMKNAIDAEIEKYGLDSAEVYGDMAGRKGVLEGEFESIKQFNEWAQTIEDEAIFGNRLDERVLAFDEEDEEFEHTIDRSITEFDAYEFLNSKEGTEMRGWPTQESYPRADAMMALTHYLARWCEENSESYFDAADFTSAANAVMPAVEQEASLTLVEAVAKEDVLLPPSVDQTQPKGVVEAEEDEEIDAEAEAEAAEKAEEDDAFLSKVKRLAGL